MSWTSYVEAFGFWLSQFFTCFRNFRKALKWVERKMQFIRRSLAHDWHFIWGLWCNFASHLNMWKLSQWLNSTHQSADAGRSSPLGTPKVPSLAQAFSQAQSVGAGKALEANTPIHQLTDRLYCFVYGKFCAFFRSCTLNASNASPTAMLPFL